MQGQGNMTLKAFGDGVRQAGKNVGQLEELGLQPSKERGLQQMAWCQGTVFQHRSGLPPVGAKHWSLGSMGSP